MYILCTPPHTLTPATKGLLTKKGIIVIETDDPDKVKVITPEVNMDSSDWFMAALHALTCRTPVDKQEHFVNNLYERLSKKEKSPEKEPEILNVSK